MTLIYLNFDPMGQGLKGPTIENEALKNNVLSSLYPMDDNPRTHEQIQHVSFCKSPLKLIL